jgi:type II secretory pathway component PulC
MIKVDRTHVVLKKNGKEEDAYMKASFTQRLSFMWELTQEVWSLKDKKNAQRRLQRNITALVKRKS